ncbi:MAG: DUF3857 domain-containing protein [Bacteroidetes bacterium]|nr:DUF3857 domain-containing protein [Bacteroidota bacterium]
MKARMITRLFAVALLLIISGRFLNAQEYLNYSWTENPTVPVLTDDEKKESAVMLKELKWYDYTFNEKGSLFMYYTRHRCIYLANETTVDDYNKIYIPMSGVDEFLGFTARTIAPDGTVSVIGQDKVKFVEDFEDNGPYNIFAFDGVVVGSTVEYIYTISLDASLWRSEFLQYSFPVRESEVRLTCPANLIFEGRGYNGFPDFTRDSTELDKNLFIAKTSNLPAVNTEKYCHKDAHKARLEIKAAYNLANGEKRLFTWNNAGERLYNYYTEISSKGKSAAAKIVKKASLPKSADLNEKLRLLESYTKNNIAILSSSVRGLSDVEMVVDKSVGNKDGILRLWTAMLSEMEIDFQIVATADRTDTPFDQKFDSWNYIDNVMLFIPKSNTFLAPTNFSSRYGFPPAEWTGQDGVFIKPVSIGKITAGLAQIKPIAFVPYNKTIHGMDVAVSFTDDMETARISLHHSLSGYNALDIQTVYQYIDEDNKKDIGEAYAKALGDHMVIKSTEIKNVDKEDILLKPLVISVEMETPYLLEKAGKNYLLKAGTLIGIQSEMYQENERKFPAEVANAHGYEREIRITIPEGYKVSGLEKFTIDVFDEENGERTVEFVSSAKTEGNIVVITCRESYRNLSWPLEKFEKFRTVVNAAADFNKITLLLEPV